MATQSNAWASGCANCCADCGTCCIVFLLGPCITYGQNVNQLRGTGFCGPCMAYCCLSLLCCQCCVAAGTRTEIRNKYGLREEPCNDCCMHFFCSPCAVCQEAHELRIQTARGNH